MEAVEKHLKRRHYAVEIDGRDYPAYAASPHQALGYVLRHKLGRDRRTEFDNFAADIDNTVRKISADEYWDLKRGMTPRRIISYPTEMRTEPRKGKREQPSLFGKEEMRPPILD